MANFRRVYQALPNGQAVATSRLQCTQTGATMQGALTPGTIQQMTVQQAQNAGFVVLPAQGGNFQSAETGAVRTVENQFGNMGLARSEFMQGAGTVRTYRISFTNNSESGAETAYIGDGNTIAYQANGGTPLPGTVVIGGTWGTNSLSIWKLVTSNTPVRVDKIRLNFGAASYLNTATLIGYKTRPDAIQNTDDYNLSTWIKPDQYQSLIIENPDPLRIVFDATYALATLIPAASTVTFTFYYVSVADVHQMRLQNA